MKGREVVLKHICNDSAKSLVFSGIVLFLSLSVLVNVIINSIKHPNEESSVLIFSGAFFFLITSLFFIMSLYKLIHPEKSSFVKKNPGILELADEHYGNLIYEDKMIAISQKYITVKSNPLFISPCDDLFLVYYHKTYLYFATADVQLFFEFRNGRINFPTLKFKIREDEVNKTLNVLGQTAPHMRCGYTPENLEYLNKMRMSLHEQN